MTGKAREGVWVSPKDTLSLQKCNGVPNAFDPRALGGEFFEICGGADPKGSVSLSVYSCVCVCMHVCVYGVCMHDLLITCMKYMCVFASNE